MVSYRNIITKSKNIGNVRTKLFYAGDTVIDVMVRIEAQLQYILKGGAKRLIIP